MCHNKTLGSWGDDYNMCWEKHSAIYCPTSIMIMEGGFGSWTNPVTNKEIRKECPYKLEHTILGQRNAE